MLRSTLTSLFALLTALAPSAVAQPSGNKIPAAGSQMPALKVFDEFGNKFSTSSLRGSYSVLVFGCLT